MTDSALRDPSHRVEQVCDVCGVLDDHPRMHHGLPDGSSRTVHHDCCVFNGCPDGPTGACATYTTTGLSGAALLAHIKNGA